MTILEFKGEDHAKLKKLANKAVEAICDFKEALAELGEEYDDEDEEIEFRRGGGSMSRRSGGSRSSRRSNYSNRYDY